MLYLRIAVDLAAGRTDGMSAMKHPSPTVGAGSVPQFDWITAPAEHIMKPTRARGHAVPALFA
jgi:hypothetical protein